MDFPLHGMVMLSTNALMTTGDVLILHASLKAIEKVVLITDPRGIPFSIEAFCESLPLKRI